MNSIPIFSYNGKFKVIWNTIVIIAVLAFSLVFSYRLTFHTYESDFLYWFLMSVFALDVVFNFNTAVKKKIDIIADRKSIAENYLKSWFVIDFIAAFPFDLIFVAIFSIFPQGMNSHSLFLFLQLLTLVKLLKVGKITKLLEVGLRINPGVMRLLIFAFWFIQAVHYMALGWIIIGAAEQGNSPANQYIRSLYWCLTTVATIGYGDYYPNHDKNFQIIYTMIVEILGVGMYGYIIGNVSGLIANLDVGRSNYIKKLEEISNFLRNKKIPISIQDKIFDYYNYLWEKKKSYSDASPIDELPHSLSMDILLYMNKSMIMKVDLFKEADELFIREAMQLLKPMVFIPDDYIIRQGEYGDCMYFLSTGEVEVLVDDHLIAKLGPGSPFGETALLVGDKRNASIRTLSYCELFRLSRMDFDSLRSRFPEFNEKISKLVKKRRQK